MLLIYLPETSSRIEYIFKFLFKHEWQIEYRTVTDLASFENFEGQKINYSSSCQAGGFFIRADTFLFENKIEKKTITVEEKHGTKVLFPSKDCDLGFDIFSSIFYMVSRYEEYLPFPPDQYGRCKASDSLAFQNDFLQKPVVNHWIEIFKNLLKQKFPGLQIKETTFDAIATYDIDIAYKFKGRDFFRTIGSTGKDLLKLNFSNISHRIKSLLNLQKDPWDVYDSLQETIRKNDLDSIFFFLMADNSRYDRNLNYKKPLMANLIKKVDSFSETGIHPSFFSSEFPEKIAIEKDRLEKITGKKITKSRQHFLKFRLPQTYNSLLAAGITEDYSMAFPEMNGFRAGTCKPFYFYDLEKEQVTALKIFPVACMDASFIYYSKFSPEKSLVEILNLMKEVKNVNGTFISIWHNDHLAADKNKKWNSVHNKDAATSKSIPEKQ